jgi:hypothetical protein
VIGDGFALVEADDESDGLNDEPPVSYAAGCDRLRSSPAMRSKTGPQSDGRGWRIRVAPGYQGLSSRSS